MFLAAMECQASRYIMKAPIETYSGPGIRKSRENVQTEWWISYWIYYIIVKKHMSPTIDNNTQIQGVHQGTPTENENFLKLQNVLALVQDNLQSKDFEAQADVKAELLICPKTSEGGITNTQHTDRVETHMNPADQVRSLERSDKQNGRFQEKYFQRKY